MCHTRASRLQAGWIWDVGQPDILVSLGPTLKKWFSDIKSFQHESNVAFFVAETLSIHPLFGYISSFHMGLLYFGLL